MTTSASAAASTVPTPTAFYVGGRWVPADDRERLSVVDPATEQEVATVPAGTAEDVDAAVQAARGAFEQWASRTPADRAALLSATADALEARTDEVALLISTEMGTPLAFSKAVQVGNPVRVLRSYAELLAGFPHFYELKRTRTEGPQFD